MRKRTKAIIAALCTVVCCGSIIAGSTYALFTSQSNVDITVTSGKVDIDVKIDSSRLRLYSAQYDLNSGKYEEVMVYDAATAKEGSIAQFTNDQTAASYSVSLEKGLLSVNHITPGDYVEFPIVVENSSSVTAQYRFAFECLSGAALMKGLEFSATIESTTVSGETADTTLLNSQKGFKSYTSKWSEISPENKSVQTIWVKVGLPITDTSLSADNEDNVYQNKTAQVSFSVEAVQGNAYVTDNNVDQPVLFDENTSIEEVTISSDIIDDSGKLTQDLEPITTSSIAENKEDAITVTASVPEGVKLNGESLALTVKEIELEDAQKEYSNIVVDDTNTTTSLNIDLVGLSADNTQQVQVDVQLEEGLEIADLYHKGTLLTTNSSNSEYYSYDADSGVLSLHVTSFSPFTISYKYNGGAGTEANPYLISTAAQLIDAMSANNSKVTKTTVAVKLLNSIEVNDVVLPTLAGGTTIIDLNSQDLKTTVKATKVINEGESVTIKNGQLDMTNTTATASSINVLKEASITLDNVQYNTDCTALYPRGDSAAVNVLNSSIHAGCYGVGTNAATVDNYNVKITIKNSTIWTSGYNGGDNTAVMINVPGTLDITNSTLHSDRQALIVRAGTATVTKSDLYCSGSYGSAQDYYTTEWKAGNEVPSAAVVLGNRRVGSYDADATLTLTDTTVEAFIGRAKIYVEAINANNKDTSLVYDGSEEVTKVYYVSTADQLKAALQVNGAQIVLKNDLDISAIDVTKSVSINLNGKTITSSGNAFQVRGQGVVATFTGDGKINAVGAAVISSTGAKAIINGGTYISTKNNAIVAGAANATAGTVVINNAIVQAQEFSVLVLNGGDLTINDGTFTSTDNIVVGTNGTSTYAGSTITINGGTFNGNITSNGYIACGVYVANNDVVTINGGTFNITGGVGVVARAGLTTIGDAVKINIIEKANLTSGKVGDAKLDITTPQYIVVDVKSGYPGAKSQITNEEGKVIKQANAIVVNNLSDYDTSIYNNPNAVDSTVIDVIYNGLKLENVEKVVNVSTESQLKEAVAENAYVVLKSDITLSSSAEVTANVVLELNGYSITNSNIVFYVNGASLTINDLTQNGKIVGEKSYGIYAMNNGSVTVNGGTIEALDAALSGNNTTGAANFYINGGVLKATRGAAIYMPGQLDLVITNGTIYGGVFIRMGQVKISGGDIYAFTSSASYDFDSIDESYNATGSIWFGNAVTILAGTYTFNDSDVSNSLKLTITGGTFHNEYTSDAQASTAVEGYVEHENGIVIYVTGKFAQDINVLISGANYDIANKNAAGFVVVDLSKLNLTNYDTNGYNSVENAVNVNA